MYAGRNYWDNAACAKCIGGVNTISSVFTDGSCKWQLVGVLYAETTKGNSIDNAIKDLCSVIYGSVNATVTTERSGKRTIYYINLTVPLPNGFSRKQCKYFLETITYSLANWVDGGVAEFDTWSQIDQNTGSLKVQVNSVGNVDGTVTLYTNPVKYLVFATKE